MIGCFQIQNPYRTMYESLRSLTEEAIHTIEQKKKQFAEKEKSLRAEREQFRAEFDALDQQMQSLQIFIDIARARAGEKVPGEKAVSTRPLNVPLLQQMTARLNLGLPGATAEALCLEAYGQQSGILEAKAALKRRQQEWEQESDLETALRAVRENCKKQILNQLSTLSSGLPGIGPLSPGKGLSADSSAAALLSLPLHLPDMESINDFPFQLSADGISFPVHFDVSKGSCTYIGYNYDVSGEIDTLIRRLIIHAASELGEKLESVLYVDPYRWNSDALGSLTAAREGEENIIHTPGDTAQAQKALQAFLQSSVQYGKTNIDFPYRICVLNGYPEEYRGPEAEAIRQLCFNADKYHLIMVLTSNHREGNCPEDLSLPFPADKICVRDQKLYMRVPFAPEAGSLDILPESGEIPATLSRKIQKKELDNNYDHRVNIDGIPRYTKGRKAIEGLPIAVDPDGRVITTAFEDMESSGFVYGATRSGKSTFLHTLITGLILTMHPDDVEIWLVDFKMTEFNRYIDHTPPHVRYIMLENSPEMVYDLLDRLMEIYHKRQIRFSDNRWTNIKEAAKAKKYIPALFVLIDEFNVMSSIILKGDSERDLEQKESLETLLTKGAAFGIHLLFSSQNFSEGLHGLSQTAKANIGWRGAMAGDPWEKTETLALKSTSERDTLLTGTLEKYHILVKRQMDAEGNQLDFGKVLYFPEDNSQHALIDRICKAFRPEKVFDLSDTGVYIDKKLKVFDGYHYTPFREHLELIQTENTGTEEVLRLYPGQPRRMRDIQAIELWQNKDENLLIAGNPNLMEDMLSLLLSIIRSAQLHPEYEIDVIMVTRDKTLRKLEELLTDVPLHTTYRSMRRCLKKHYKLPDSQVEKPFQSLLILIDYPGILDAIENKTAPDDHGEVWEEDDETKDDPEYDDNFMINRLLEKGSRLGRHVITVVKAPQDLEQAAKYNSHHYRHFIFFRTPSQDSAVYVRRGESRIIENLPGHTFRYTNPLESVSYRPYLHEQIRVDGWVLRENGEAEREQKTAEAAEGPE